MAGNSIQDHYAGDDTGSAMASRILGAVRAVYGSDAAITPETLAPLDHFNARGVAATQELARSWTRRRASPCWTSAAALAAPRAGSRRGTAAR